MIIGWFLLVVFEEIDIEKSEKIKFFGPYSFVKNLSLILKDIYILNFGHDLLISFY